MSSKTDPAVPAKEERLYAIIRELEVGMLTTARADGTMHTRPMVTRFGDTPGVLWFFTSESAHVGREVAGDRHVAVAYADPKRQVYACISGSATVVRDRALMNRLWTPLLITWLPKGLDDPALALLQVKVRTGEYWDAPSETMVEIIAAVQSALDHPPPVDTGEHVRVDVKKRRER
jgi:general stress protein 26